MSCVMASKWTQSLGSLHHPVSTHEAAFRAPSNHRIHPDHQYNSPSQQPHGRPPLQTNTPFQSTVFRVTPTAAARVPTCPTAHSSIGLRHPRGRPFVNHATLHSKLAALPACTGHACEGSKWPRETHLTARMRWRSKELKWEGQKWMDGQTRAVGIPRAHDAKPISTNKPTDANSSQGR